MSLIQKIRLGAAAVLLSTVAQGSAQVAAQLPPGSNPPLRPLAVTQLDGRQHGSDLDSMRPVSITLSDATPITDLLLLIVRGTRLSVVPDPDVQGMFRGDLKDVTLRQALEMILQPHGYDYSVQGNVIRVFRRKLETRRFDLNYVVTRRAGSGSNAVTQVTDVDAGDIFVDLSTGVQTLVSPEGRFNVDKKAALLQATDFPDRLDQIQLYLDAVQHRATRQVQIQAMVIEVVLNDEFAGGLDWPLLIERAGDSIAPTQNTVPAAGGAMTVGLNIRNFAGLLSAFGTQGTVNLMASPTVNALNNEPAMMRVGTQDVYFKTTATDAGTGRAVRTAEPQAITEGVVLNVTPQIASDGMVNMSIAPSLTERTGQATSRFGDTVPILSVREANTTVRVHDRETVVVAGLMDQRVRPESRKVPLLGDIPGIGGMFRGEKTRRRKTELIILLTPTIMTPARIAQATATELEQVR